MNKYIDADKLRAEIEKNTPDRLQLFVYRDIILALIDSLQQEQPEVDIVTEYDEQFYSDPVYRKLTNRNAGIAIARHFYNLGLNARKEENK